MVVDALSMTIKCPTRREACCAKSWHGLIVVGTTTHLHHPVWRYHHSIPGQCILKYDDNSCISQFGALDQVDETMDYKLAQHLVGLYPEDNTVGGIEGILVCSII